MKAKHPRQTEVGLFETPVPVKGTVSTELAALEVMETFAVLEPAVVGVKVTVMTQDSPAESDPPHVELPENWLEFVPVIEIFEIVSVAVPVFVRVVCWPLEVVLTA